MKNLITSGELQRMFLAEDANTIIRRPNCRKFCLDNDIFMEIHEKAWLIDIENFMSKVNPKSMSEHYEVPRLRNLRYCVNSWNKRYKRWQIDKHDIEYLIKNEKIFSFKHGNRWVLNYDEVLKELKVYVKTYKCHPNAKKKRKKIELVM